MTAPPPGESPSSASLARSRERFQADLDAGTPLSLSEYLSLFPGADDAIAEEFLSQRRGTRGTAGALGTTIGPFKILDEIGRGGQGVVYRALDDRIGREIALKVLRSSGTDADRLIERFRREARVAASINHPGICGILEAGGLEGVPYIAMPPLQGSTLGRKLSDARWLFGGTVIGYPARTGFRIGDSTFGDRENDMPALALEPAGPALIEIEIFAEGDDIPEKLEFEYFCHQALY